MHWALYSLLQLSGWQEMVSASEKHLLLVLFWGSCFIPFLLPIFTRTHSPLTSYLLFLQNQNILRNEVPWVTPLALIPWWWKPTTVGCSNITSYQTQQYCYPRVLTEVVCCPPPGPRPPPGYSLPSVMSTLPSQSFSEILVSPPHCHRHQSCRADVWQVLFLHLSTSGVVAVQYTAQKILAAPYVSCLLFWLCAFTLQFSMIYIKFGL